MQQKTILITGSTRGIGFGLAQKFLEKGHNIIINGRSAQTVNNALKMLEKYSGQLTYVVGEVQTEETYEQLKAVAIEKFETIDIWINNAGIPQSYDFFRNLESRSIKNLIDVNVYGLSLGTKQALNFFEKQGYGKVFNMEGFGSDGRTMPKLALYGSSKRFVNYFTKAVSKEVQNPNIQVGIISPGMVRTEFIDRPMDGATEKERKQFEKVYRILAEDVEPVAAFLVNGMLKSTKKYDRINFLSGFRLMGKIVRLMIA